MDLAILGASPEFPFCEAESADEALVETDGLLAGAAIIATPNVELAVGTARVAGTIGVPSSARVGGHLV